MGVATPGSYPISPRQARTPELKNTQRAVLDELFSATYEELRRLASFVNRSGGRTLLSPTTLVNEAWLKLSRSHSHQFESPVHFKATAARAMRQILVQVARKQGSLKRGGEVVFVDFVDSAASFQSSTIQCDQQLLALHESLDELGRMNPRQALLVECRYFGGMEVSETAELLKVSETTILREWRAAKAFLSVQIRKRCSMAG